MPTLKSVMAELKSNGSEEYRLTYARHGMDPARLYGVSIADLKIIAKTLKKQQALALELYASGIMDAMYLAGMVADGAQMSAADLDRWAKEADGLQMISEYTVPWVTVEHPESAKLAVKWMDATRAAVASSGWCSYSGLVTVKPDEALDLKEIEKLLGRVEKEVHTAQNRVRMTMNSFVIAVGSYVLPLGDRAKATARKIGNVSVDVGDTACKVPVALEYITKAEAAGKAGKKKQTIRC
jgi:3-methyladenine DNA glycosylase AlkD